MSEGAQEFLASHCGPHNADLIRRGMDCDLSLAEALKAVTAALSQSEWQDIATATEEIERCLLWNTDCGGKVVMGRVAIYDGAPWPYGDGMNGDWQFSHYMPLPPPPQDTP